MQIRPPSATSDAVPQLRKHESMPKALRPKMRLSAKRTSLPQLVFAKGSTCRARREPAAAAAGSTRTICPLRQMASTGTRTLRGKQSFSCSAVGFVDGTMAGGFEPQLAENATGHITLRSTVPIARESL